MILVFGLEDVGGHGRSLAVYLLDKNQTVKEANLHWHMTEEVTPCIVKTIVGMP